MPSESIDCTYCGCDVTAHDPVYVREGVEREDAGQFCNYGCLAAYLDSEDLTVGTTCAVSLEDA